jgi:hypothetical protein
MTWTTVTLLLILAIALGLVVRDRHVRGWKRPLFRSRGYDPVAAGKVAGKQSGWVPGGGGGGSDGGGGGF